MENKLVKPQLDVEKIVRKNLLATQKKSDKREMCHREPQRWCEIAVYLMNGSSGLEIRNKTGAGHYSIKRVEAQMSEELGEVAKEKAMNLRVLTNQTDELLQMVQDQCAAKGEVSKDDAFAITQLGKAGIGLQHRVERTEGRADVVVEQRVISDSDLQETASAARERLAEIKKADVIDIEVAD